MNKRLLPVLLALSGSAIAQTPSAPLMPDGSRDMYLGLGVVSAPRYAGADDRRTRPSALVQFQWSNGVFLSGLNLGMHLSSTPGLEYGPLLSVDPGRDASGTRKLSGIGGVDLPAYGILKFNPDDIPDIGARLTAGGFVNRYFGDGVRLTSSLLHGAGDDRRGLLWNVALQKTFAGLPAHHHVSVTAGVTWANRRYMQEYFGVLPSQTSASLRTYSPSAGVRDAHVTVNWNRELSPQWLWASQLTVARMMSEAADSPLTFRRNNLTVRTGLAYRF